ncbi:MFS transporter [Paenibacillus sp. GD4]|uniref:MFS transporter n=1 Tax=Paenibacillus sp. GD4 TaxID=3068890 RepID=UPI0027965D53|nr:MFS transporter [Paenibacillus sp. GD4]MDQ1910452.1 MFS transporter [Paenibacillus sp. GD4]
MKTFLWCGYGSYLLIGLAHVIVGSLLPEMLSYYAVDYSSGGQLIALQFAGFLVGVLSGPWWSARLGKRGALLLSLTCLTAAELVFALLPPWTIVMTVAPLAGFGFGMVETVIGALVIQYLEEQQKTKVMTRLEVFFGVGALVMPLISSLMIALGMWRGAFIMLATSSAALLLMWLFLPLGSMTSLMSRTEGGNGGTEAVSPQPSKGAPVLYLAVFLLIFLVYVGTEMSIANFLPSMFIETLHVKPEIGALSATCFWGAMAIGRLFAANVVERVGTSRYLLWSIAGATLLLGAFAMNTGPWGSFALVLLIGLMLSGMFAILLIYANGFFPGREERITSLLIASGGVGGALLPLLTGWSMDRFTVEQTLLVPVMFSALLLLLIGWASRFPKTSAVGKNV